VTDQELILQLQNPESRNAAFGVLVQKYQQKIYWHIRKMVIDHDDTDDILQETFVKAWQGFDGFRGDSQLFTWLYRIATNECLNFLAKKKRRFFVSINTIESDLLEKLETATTQTGALISGDDIELKLQKALLKLPEKQRLVFNMKYFDELKYEDIADITGTSVGALKASYHYAVTKIEKILNEPH
jgi:RNA polymerase sigma factor (sigma-70 family)